MDAVDRAELTYLSAYAAAFVRFSMTTGVTRADAASRAMKLAEEAVRRMPPASESQRTIR